MAILSNILWLQAFRLLASNYWPAFIDRFQSNSIAYVMLVSVATWIVHAANLLFYCTIEHFDLFQQYKVNKSSMWDVDPQGWSRLRNRSIWLNFVNVYLVGTFMVYLGSLVSKTL